MSCEGDSDFESKTFISQINSRNCWRKLGCIFKTWNKRETYIQQDISSYRKAIGRQAGGSRADPQQLLNDC